MAKSLRKRIKNSIIYFFIRIILIFFQLISRPQAFVIARFLGRLSFWVLKRERIKIRNNLKFAYEDELTEKELNQIAKSVIIYLAMNAVDSIRTPLINAKNIDDIVEVHGLEYFDKAYKRGNGIVVIAPHLGNFQLLASYFSLKGYIINVIAAPLYDSKLDEILIKYRKMHGLHNISRGIAIKEAIRCLKRGEVLGVLPDQDTRVSGVFVPFFGKPAHTAVGPASLAIKTGASIMVMATHLSEEYKHVIDIEPELELIRTGNRKQDILELIKEFQVDGVIFYTLSFCQPYEMESIQLEKSLKAAGIPVLSISTDYSSDDEGQLKTRIEAFLEMLK